MEYLDSPYNLAKRQEPTSPKAKGPNTTKSKQGPRKRVSQACDRCRSRKDKCDGGKPACSTCTTHGRVCSYDTNVRKRGLPEGYVRGLEKLWGLAIGEVTGVEDNVLLAITGEGCGGTFLADWNDEGNSDKLVESWRQSKISKELENLLSNTEQTSERKRKHIDSISRADNRTWLSAKPTNSQDPREPARNSWADKKPDNYPKDSSLESASLPEQCDDRNRSLGKDESILNPPYLHGPSSKRHAVSTGYLDLPSEAWHLINVYSSYTHPWLPIIERQDLLRTTFLYLRKPSEFSISGEGSGNHAVLWAVMAYEKFQHRAINNIPQAQGLVADLVWTAERMYHQARNLIPDEEGIFELSHVQALLILALANMGNGHLSRAWLLIGQAVRIAIDLGLGLPSDNILNALKSQSRAKHVFMGCFVLDTIISARLGRRPHLKAEDVELIGPVEEEGLDEWDPWSDCLTVSRTSPASRPAAISSTFNRFVKLIQILNEAICERDSAKGLQSVKTILNKLHAWNQSQSSLVDFESKSEDTEQNKAPLPHHYNLKFAYYNSIATIQLMSHNQNEKDASLELSAQSARQIAELLIQHSSKFGLLIVPPTFEYFVKSAYDVIRAVQSSVQEMNINLASWKHSLDIYIDMMEPAWPIFGAFKSLSSYQTPSTCRRASQVAFELISGTHHLSNTPTTSIPTSISSGQTSYAQISRYQSGGLINGEAQHPRAVASPTPTRTRIYNPPPGGQFVTNNYAGAQSTFNIGNPAGTGSQHSNSHQPQIRPSSNLGTAPAQLRQGASITSETLDLDPMFQEFATLDATEWAANWDQSLVNLGFTNPDSMNQDFYTMSREPDPRSPSSVFQQLMANSNLDARNLAGGSASGITRRYQITSNDEHEGIEASHILQSLSTADDIPTV